MKSEPVTLDMQVSCTKDITVRSREFNTHGGGGGGGGGTLIFSHIHRLRLFFCVQNSEFQYFLGFSEK